VRDRVPLFAGLTLLALAVGLGSVFIADGIRDRNRSDDTITVTGSAKKRIVSDYIVWTASLTTERPTAGAAVRELGGWTARVRAFFRTEGVRPSELTVEPVTALGPGDVSDEGFKVKGYRLTRFFEIRSVRVTQVTTMADRTSMLLAQGIPLAADPPEYVYTRLPALRPQLLTAAIKDAQRRARVLVDATGVRLGKLRGVDVGVFQVTSPNSTEVSDYGTYDTSTLPKDVTAVVNVTFALG
jgi:hypothetical protein